MKKKKLYIAFDPGFDAAKVVIDRKIAVSVPYVVEELKDGVNKYDGNKTSLQGKNLVIRKGGATYQVGAVPKKKKLYLSSRHSKTQNLNADTAYNLETRFGTKEFEAGFDAILGYSLVQYEKATKGSDNEFKISKLNDYEIILSVALPHDSANDIWETSLKTFLKGKNKNNPVLHEFTLTLGDSEEYEFSFPIDKIGKETQPVCAFWCELLDDDFNEKCDIEEITPCVVILAGYKTLERFEYHADGNLFGTEAGNAVSSEDYAMYNIQKEICDSFNTKYGADIRVDEIEAAFYNKCKLEVAVKNEKDPDAEDNVVVIRVVEEVEKELEKKCSELVKDTMKNFQSLVNRKRVFVAGGTGSLYYEYIKKNLEGREHLKDKVKLIEGDCFDGTKHSVFAVADGLCKLIMAQENE